MQQRQQSRQTCDENNDTWPTTVVGGEPSADTKYYGEPEGSCCSSRISMPSPKMVVENLRMGGGG
jgi:hypothetical protein